MKIKRITKAIVLLWLTTLIACQKKEQIQIAGSTTVLPVLSQIAEQFRLTHPELNLIVNGGGSGVGINQLGEGKIQIGMASREITQTEIEQYPTRNFIIHTIGRDAVVPVVSSEIYEAGVKALTLKQIANIYKGVFNNWKDVGGPDQKILVVDKEQSRGTRHVFMKAVMGDKEANAPGADLVLGSNNEEQTAITQSKAAIGMLSNAWLNQDVKGLGIITPEGTVIEATLENIINNSYPITRQLYLITDGAPQGTIKELLNTIFSTEGQKIVAKSGYVPLK